MKKIGISISKGKMGLFFPGVVLAKDLCGKKRTN